MSEQPSVPPAPGFEPASKPDDQCDHEDCGLEAAEHKLGFPGCSYPGPGASVTLDA